jgi:uncharacterized protein
VKALALAFLVVTLGADFAIPPVPTHFVTDNAGALSASARSALESRLHDYETATGHQVIVWIGQTTGDVPLENWTGETAHQWQIGRKGHDDGAVLFLFMADHKVRIEIGYGLEGALPDADASRIIRDIIVPKMRTGDVDGAVAGGVAAMIATITPSYKGVTPPPQTTGATDTPLNAADIFAIVALVFLVCLAIMVLLRLAAGGRRGETIGSRGASTSGFFGGLMSSGGSSSDFDSGGGDDFSAGGGDFGGGGASGGW